MVDQFHTFDRTVGYPTVLTGRKIVRLLFLNLRMYDITPEQWTVLRFLGERDGITQKELSDLTGKDQPTLTRILTIMDRKGWIDRRANREDRRSFLVWLTGNGLDLLEQLRPLVEASFERMLDGISEEQLQILRQVLQELDRNIENEFERLKIK